MTGNSCERKQHIDDRQEDGRGAGEWLDWAAHHIWPDEETGKAGVRPLAENGIDPAR